jgi:hypothetical protein
MARSAYAVNHLNLHTRRSHHPHNRCHRFNWTHLWRPASIKGQPGRVCCFCEKAEVISKEEFYALFGRPFIVTEAMKK